MNWHELDKAANGYRQAIRCNPSDFNAHISLGNALRAQGKPAEAEEIYRQAIRLQPDCAEVYSNLCIVLREQAKLDEALVAVRRTIQMKPGFPDAHSNMGNVLLAQGKRVEAAAAYREAIRLRPDFADACGNLAVVLTDLGELEEAVDLCRRAIQLKPNHAEEYLNLGNALRSRGELAEATAAFQQALQLKPDLAEAHVNLAMALLLQGDFPRGFREFEWRWQLKNASLPRRDFAQPQWKGEALSGRAILLHAEQGFGDSIQFIRFAPRVAELGGNVILECPPQLLRLFAEFPGVAQIIAAGEPLPLFDLQCPLASLPLALGTRLDAIPSAAPYLKAEPHLVEKWKALLPQSARDLKVGVAWAGSPAHKNDRHRSIHPEMLAPLAAVNGVSLVSLQAGQSSPKGLHFVDLHDRLTDFAETAALIAHLDLVISVDTAVAHLAAALGKPTYVFIPFAPDWRWLLHREDSPWYPTIRVFRQPAIGDWAPVIQRVAAALAKHAKSAK